MGNNKKPLPNGAGVKVELISVSTFSGLKTVLAINGLVGRRSKGNFRLPTALGTYGGIHLPTPIPSAIALIILPCSSATWAPLWFVLEAFFPVKGLFAFCEEKFCPTVSASNCFV